jgi:hypothetical protein
MFPPLGSPADQRESARKSEMPMKSPGKQEKEEAGSLCKE